MSARIWTRIETTPIQTTDETVTTNGRRVYRVTRDHLARQTTHYHPWNGGTYGRLHAALTRAMKG